MPNKLKLLEGSSASSRAAYAKQTKKREETKTASNAPSLFKKPQEAKPQDLHPTPAPKPKIYYDDGGF